MYIPVLNIHRKDYPCHTEVRHIFNHHGICDELLTFRDDIDLVTLQQGRKLRLSLVDHNVLSSRDQPLEESVVEIIDHHLWERPESER